MSLHISHVFGVWCAAALTLFIFSFLYKDNPFYKFAEHLFVGVSAGYTIILNYWTVLDANLIQPLILAAHGTGTHPELHGAFAAQQGDYRMWLVIPAIFGALLFTRLIPRIGWMSRLALAVIIGVYAGIKTTGFAQGDFVAQVQASLVPLWNGSIAYTVNTVVFAVGLITSLLFFFFSREHKGGLGVASRTGMYFLMVSFGAAYGYTVMSRISLLIGRFQFLLETWLGLR